ncbi:MAG: MATE family efflux transporter [Gammaproteobacteria bacterium]
MSENPNAISINQTPSWQGVLAESKLYIRIGLPILLTQLLLMCNGVIDTLMAGRSDRLQIGSLVRVTGLDSSQELAGIAIGNGLWILIMMFALGFLFAITPLVAELFGARKISAIGLLIRRLVWVSLGIGLMMMGLGMLTAFTLEPWLQEETREITTGYLYLVSFSGIPLAFITMLRGYSEGMTFVRPVTFITLLGVLLNIPLNLILIYGLFGLEPLGGVGCAIATTISNWTVFFVLLAYVRLAPQYRSSNLFAEFKLPIHLPTIKKLFTLGTPIAITMLIELSMFPGITFLVAIKHLEPALIAGHQITMTIAGVLYMFPLAIAITATIRIGGLVGGHKYPSIYPCCYFALGLCLVQALFNSSALLAFRYDIAALFSDQPKVIATAATLMAFALFFQVFDGLQGTAIGLLRGFANTFVPMLCVAFSYWIVGIPMAYLVAFTDWTGFAPQGVYGLWFGMTLGLMTVAGLLLIYLKWYLKSNRWRQPNASMI